jgi:predicted amidophosphoribosyltransferase
VPSARELILPLRGALVPIPAQPQDGVCSICHSSAKPGFSHCLPCAEAAAADPPEILPITLSVHGELIHSHLRNYKDSPTAGVRSRMSLRLAALLATFMANHSRCVGEWDYATCVPSATRVALQPVVDRIQLFAGRYRQVLTSGPEAEARLIDPARFAVSPDVRGHRILLLDDTFVSGASVFSAAGALRDRAARVVGPVVIGRHVQRGWPPSAELLSWITKRPWDETRCARCAGERPRASLF